jgi:hypothetical protein
MYLRDQDAMSVGSDAIPDATQVYLDAFGVDTLEARRNLKEECTKIVNEISFDKVTILDIEYPSVRSLEDNLRALSRTAYYQCCE